MARLATFANPCEQIFVVALFIVFFLRRSRPIHRRLWLILEVGEVALSVSGQQNQSRPLMPAGLIATATGP